MTFFNRWINSIMTPSSPAYFEPHDSTVVSPTMPPIGGPTETKPSDEADYKKLLEEMNREKVAVHTINILTPGDDNGPYNFEYFICKSLAITDEHSIHFRTLLHNKRTGKKAQENVPDLADYPPMLEGEHLIDYIVRVEALPHMEWNDMYFDETMSIRYRGRTVYRYDESENKYEYIRGDKLSTKEMNGNEKSSVLPFKPNKDD